MAAAKPPLIIRILNRFTYSQKFILISLLFAFSLFVSGYFMIQDQNQDIEFAQKELKGISYLRSLQKLMASIPEHAWKAHRYLSGDTHLKNELLNLSTEISADFKYLNDIDLEFQIPLETTLRDLQRQNIPDLQPSQLEAQWNNIVNQMSNLSPGQSNELHDKLIANLRSLMLYIGETSNLLLDPTVEVNYFIQTILWDLPKAQVYIPKMINTLENIFKSEKVSQADEDQLVILIASLESNLKDIQRDTRKALHNQFITEKSNFQIEDTLKEPLTKYFNAVTLWLNYVQSVSKIIHTEKPDFTEVRATDYLSLASSALEANFNAWDKTVDQVEKILETRVAKYKRRQFYSIVVSLISAIVGLTLGLYVMRQISKPLSNLVEAAKRLAAGDLSTRVRVADENEVGQVGIAFNHMAEAFQEIIGKLQRTSLQLTTSTAEIASVASQQEASIVEQEATTKQIATTARNISASAKEFAKTMNDVSNTAEQTSSLASLGKAGLNQMENIMRQMVDASQNIAAKLAVLNEKAGNITSVITTITKVADQTNLLSLNAAIEAEKAGEHGRTFAVIAREIRRLADQTGNATLDIEKMVTEMVSAVSAGVMSVDKFSEEIHSGVSQVDTVGEQLTKIIEQVQQQTDSFENVNKGMQAQFQEAEQINESINQLSEAAQNASESIRQFHLAIEQLNKAAQDMQVSVTSIKQ